MSQQPHKKINKIIRKTKYKKGAIKSRKDLLTKEFNKEIVEGFMETFGRNNKRRGNKK